MFRRCGSIEEIEAYMEKHQFLDADKLKVREFIRKRDIVEGILTRNEFCYRERNGMCGVCSRTFLGIQDNFV